MGESIYMKHFFWLVLCSIMAACTMAFAHNDMSADVQFEALFDSSGFIGIRNHWTFEEEYSASSILSVDENGNGTLDAREIPLLQKLIVDTLVEANYNNYVLSGSRFLQAKGISDFKASVKSGRLTLDFTVAFSEPAGKDYTMLVIVVYDNRSKILMDVDTDGAKVKFPKSLDVEFFPDWLKGITMLKAFDSSVRGLFLRYRKM